MNKYKSILMEAQKRAEENQECKRKAVGCAIIIANGKDSTVTIFSQNGPSTGHICSNELGNCGCAHAEPRAILRAVYEHWNHCTLVCMYSPCTNCANIIVDSGVVDKVVWDIDTNHDMRGLHILKNSGIELEKIGAEMLDLFRDV